MMTLLISQWIYTIYTDSSCTYLVLYLLPKMPFINENRKYKILKCENIIYTDVNLVTDRCRYFILMPIVQPLYVYLYHIQIQRCLFRKIKFCESL